MIADMETFGRLIDGEPATLYTLWNRNGLSVSLCNYGARIVRLLAPDRAGVLADVALGYASVEPYESADDCFGAVCGRYANRLAGGVFRLGGKEYHISLNDGENALHGGLHGFHQKLWHGEPIDGGVCFSCASADGEEGFPGNLELSVSYRLTDNDVLSIEYDAISDADTVLNLTNHNYFNLAGHASGVMHAQTLQVFADYFTPADAALLPTGEICPVLNTPFDFRASKPIGRDIDDDCAQLKNGGGYDHNFVLRKPERGALSLAARACEPAGGRTLEVWTTLPGLQLYTSNMLPRREGKQGAVYGPRHAFCLETQLFPDSMRHTHFPSPVLEAGRRYRSCTEFRLLIS